jgi:hypothetical protein
VAVIFGFLYILSSKASFLYAFFWSLIVGFYTFLINGHLYKIIPFLVWFHRYAPLVGKRKVPMLHQMYPKKKADYHFYFGAIGTFVSLVGLVIGNWDIFKGGISYLIISAFYLIISVFEMLNETIAENSDRIQNETVLLENISNGIHSLNVNQYSNTNVLEDSLQQISTSIMNENKIFREILQQQQKNNEALIKLLTELNVAVKSMQEKKRG